MNWKMLKTTRIYLFHVCAFSYMALSRQYIVYVIILVAITHAQKWFLNLSAYKNLVSLLSRVCVPSAMLVSTN